MCSSGARVRVRVPRCVCLSLTVPRAILDIPRYASVRPADDEEHRLLLLHAQSEGPSDRSFRTLACGAKVAVN